MPVLTLSNPATVHATGGRYSHAALVEGATRWLVVSGQVGARQDGSVVEGTAAQMDQAFGNLLAVLAAHGMTPANVVKSTAFLVSRDDLSTYRDARKRAFGDHACASTLLFVAGLADPKYIFEFECEAVA